MNKEKDIIKNNCKICNNSVNNELYITKEMLYGTREIFKYIKCSKCGCLQLVDKPKDLGQYYPSNYYSFRYENVFKKYLRIQWAKYSYYKKKSYVIGWLIFLFKSDYKDIMYLKMLDIDINSKILDVGCGGAHTLLSLSYIGFNHLAGVDPFIQNSYTCNDIEIHKKEITELNEKYDLIMSNWSCEHMDNQLKIMENFYRLLNKNGILILRIPIVDSFAWKKYKENWYNLDPPRHLYIHSYNSINSIISKVGLSLENIFHESDWRSLFYSDCYQANISGVDLLRITWKIKAIFLKLVRLKKYLHLNKQINFNQESDSVCFIIKKVE